MDSIKDTLADMMEMFHKKMSDFEAELQKSPNTSSTTSKLAAEFASFRGFITGALSNLQRQVEFLACSVDNLEMRSRRKILLLHGVKEANKEDTALAVAKVISERLNISDFTPDSIKRCHRMGRACDPPKSRPILFKLHDTALRDKLWYNKTKLKGSGITMSEFLTKTRHDVFMAAREKFGVNKCWTQEGSIYVVGADGARIRVVTLQDVNNIDFTDHDKAAVRAKNTRSKRTATGKK